MNEKPMGKRALRKSENAAKNKELNGLGGGKKFWYGLIALFLFSAVALVQFAMQLSKFLEGNTSAAHLDTQDNEKLKEVFFSGAAHVVFCQDDKTEMLPAPDVYTQIIKQAQGNKPGQALTFWTANCFRAMSSGKSISERFSLGKKEGYIAIFGNEEPPLMLNYLRDPSHVLKQIISFTKTEITKLTYIKDWDSLKSKRSYVLLGSNADAPGTETPTSSPAVVNNEKLLVMRQKVKPFVEKYRKVKFATVDMDFWKMDTGNKAEESDNDALELAANFHTITGGAVCISKVVGSTDGDDLLKSDKKDEDDGAGASPTAEKKVKYYGQVLQSWEGDALENFIQQCQAGGDPETWTKIYRKPRIFARPSEVKKVVAPSRKGKATEEDEGLKKGGKEAVGRRQEEAPADDDDDDIDADEAVEEVVEEDI